MGYAVQFYHSLPCGFFFLEDFFNNFTKKPTNFDCTLVFTRVVNKGQFQANDNLS